LDCGFGLYLGSIDMGGKFLIRHLNALFHLVGLTMCNKCVVPGLQMHVEVKLVVADQWVWNGGEVTGL
jgi:hypothetical protein